MNKTIHIFIVSWPGQHENALHIAKTLNGASEYLSIIFSGADSSLINSKGSFNYIICDDQSFWGDKFQTSIQHCCGEIMLMIHADCLCRDWLGLLKKCRVAMQTSEIAVYAPYILGTPWTLQRCRLKSHTDSELVDVAQTDMLVFALSAPIINRMKHVEYINNKFGWGVDWIFVSASYANGYRVVVDTSIRVIHSIGSGYSRKQAASEMGQFLLQMNQAEAVQYKKLIAHIKQRTSRRPNSL